MKVSYRRKRRSTTWSFGGALAVNTRRRLAEKSTPAAITTQERIDGYLGKSNEDRWCDQVELANNMELSITGHVLTWARQSKFSGRTVAETTDGWNLKNHSHLTVARHFREKTHPSMLVVTIREGEEQEESAVQL